MSQTRVTVQATPLPLPNVDGYPTRQRVQQGGVLQLGDGKGRTADRCVMVPHVKPPDHAVKTKKQPLEQALTEAEYRMLAIYVYKAISTLSTPKTSNHEAVGGGGYESKTPFSEQHQLDSNWLAAIEEPLSIEQRRMLLRLVHGCIADNNLDLKAIGYYITGSKDIRQQTGGFKGYYKATAQQILQNDKNYQQTLHFEQMRAIGRR